MKTGVKMEALVSCLTSDNRNVSVLLGSEGTVVPVVSVEIIFLLSRTHFLVCGCCKLLQEMKKISRGFSEMALCTKSLK